jgi:hypothetical protein
VIGAFDERIEGELFGLPFLHSPPGRFRLAWPKVQAYNPDRCPAKAIREERP